MPIPKPKPPPPNPSSSCLLAALRHHIAGGRLSPAISLLPSLSRAGLRPPFALLSSLVHLLLHQPTSSSFPFLARRLLFYLRLSGLSHLVPSSTRLSNHLLSLHFILRRPGDAQHLFAKMPHPNIYSYNAMLAGYARLALATPAAELFTRMPHRDLVSYNAALLALARGGATRKAVALYSHLRLLSPSLGYSHYTFSALLVACARLADAELPRQLHAHLALLGFLTNVVIASSIVDVYAKCGCIGDAGKLFDEMPMKDVRAWTSLVYGYVKAGLLVAAHRLFDEMPERNVVSWNALIGGHVRSGQPEEALDLLRNLIEEGVRPDQFTFSSCLCVCATIASLKHGKQIHGRLLRTRFNPNMIVLSSLIDMYSKCGDLAGGRRVFDQAGPGKRDTVLWNTMMSMLCQHGHGQEVIGLFHEMIRERQKPDANTFLVILTACSHCSLVDEGMKFFESMAERHGVVPREVHYVCLVDLLSSTGSLDEVVEWIRRTPYRSSPRVWRTLLGACKMHGNTQLTKQVEEHLAELESLCSAASVRDSSMHTEYQSWDCLQKASCLMEDGIDEAK